MTDNDAHELAQGLAEDLSAYFNRLFYGIAVRPDPEAGFQLVVLGTDIPGGEERDEIDRIVQQSEAAKRELPVRYEIGC